MNRPRPVFWVLALLACLSLPAVSLADDDDGPQVRAVAVTEVELDHAHVSGAVEPGSEPTRWWFEYGSTVHDARATLHEALDASGTVSAELPGLAAGTKYYFRLVAESDGETAASSLKSFTTPGTPVPVAPSPAEPPGAPPAPTPVTGETIVAASAAGDVLVRLPGAAGFAALGAAEAIPVGSIVDATRGSVTLAADTGAATQRGTFGGSRFVLRQREQGKGYVNLHLRGGDFTRCRPRGARVLAVASGRRAHAKPVRNLWGRDRGGRFRTHGRDSVATVRGTRWSMVDRCDGTVTRVSEGAVDVRVRRTGRVVRVRAGQRHLARHHR